MKNKIWSIALAAVLVMVLCSCGGSRTSAESEKPSFGYASPEELSLVNRDSAAYDKGLSFDYQDGAAPEAPDAKDGSADPGLTQLTSPRDNTKVIYTADLSIQSVEFEKTCDYIRQLAAEKGGYMEVESINNNSYNSPSKYRTAVFKVRVPAEGYQDFIGGVNSNCHVVSLKQNMEDVGAQYFDIEQKLETLNNKHDRLEALLKEASDMTDIISLENALSETEYEINRFRTTLNRYDSLISFSTVNISLREVERPDSAINEQPGFFERLGKSFSEGFGNFAEGMSELAMWISYNILTIVVLVIIVIVIIKIHPIRRIRTGAASKKAEKTKASDRILISSESSAEKKD